MGCDSLTLGSLRTTDLTRGTPRVNERKGTKNKHVVRTYSPNPGLTRNELAIMITPLGSSAELISAAFINISVQDCRSEPISNTCRTARAPAQPPTKLNVATAF